jgi:hypothetical protein
MCRSPIVTLLPPSPPIGSILPCAHDRLSLDIAGIKQSLLERRYEGESARLRPAVQETDRRHHLLLRPQREWPPHRRAAEQRDEFASPHNLPLGQDRTLPHH